jgi:DNA-binding SARP family transcriptional activator
MRVQLLGGFGVEVGARRVEAARWRLRKARTVVKLLTLEPTQRLHREHLLHPLWPDLPPPAAANNLHQALHAARRALAGEVTDGLLEPRDHVVVLPSGGPVEVDVARFRALAAAAPGSDDLDALRAADAAYHGELLPEDRYETWAQGPRQTLAALHRDVLIRLGDRLRPAAQLAEAEPALPRALEGDPLHEPALHALLPVLAEQGRRPAALVRYEQVRDALRSAYGTDPDPETRRLCRELPVGSATAEEAQPAGSFGTGRHNLPPAVTSFVGRNRELAQVQRLLQRGRLRCWPPVGNRCTSMARSCCGSRR